MRRIFAAVAISLLASGSLNAAAIINSSTFLPGPINIAFDNPVLAPDTPVTNQYIALGATFSNALQGDVGNAGIPNQDSSTIQDFMSNGPVSQPLTITFNKPVTAADFSLAQQPGTALITSYLGGVGGTQVDQFTATTSSVFQANNIEGFKNSLFDTITITVTSSDRADILDNLQFTNVPEPTSLVALCGIGMAGLFLLARRHRQE